MRYTLLKLTAFGFALVAGGCSPQGEQAAAGNPQAAPAAHLVELAPVQRELLAHRVERTGTLRARREAKIFSQEEGGVREVPVHEGDTVRVGDVLVRLDDRILRAKLAQARARRQQAEVRLKRLRRLVKKRLVSEETLTQAVTELEVSRAEERLLRTRLGYMTIRAPFAGQVAERRVNPGDVAPKHAHLITLVDPSSLTMQVSVSELLLPRLQVGDPAQVRIDALGPRVFQGQILRIFPTVDPATRRGQIEILLKPVPPGAKAGQFSRVTLRTRGTPALVIPLAGLKRDRAGEYVFRVEADQTARRVGVRSGLRLGDRVEILSGLEAGQDVVVSGFLGLADGMRVKAVTRRPAASDDAARRARAAADGDA